VADKLKIMKKYIIIPFLFVAVNLFSQPINQSSNNQDQRQPQNNQQQMQQQNNNQQMQQQNNQQEETFQPQPQQPMYNNNKNYYGNKSAKYRKMKVNGIVLASVGGAMLIGGLALLSDGISRQVPVNSYNSGPLNGGGAIIETFGGAVFTIVGALATTGGTLMAILGSKKEKDMAAANRNRVSVIIAPTAFRIAYTF